MPLESRARPISAGAHSNFHLCTRALSNRPSCGTAALVRSGNPNRSLTAPSSGVQLKGRDFYRGLPRQWPSKPRNGPVAGAPQTDSRGSGAWRIAGAAQAPRVVRPRPLLVPEQSTGVQFRSFFENWTKEEVIAGVQCVHWYPVQALAWPSCPVYCHTQK